MWTGLALWQEILLLGLAAISLVYVLYFRIWVALAAGSDLLFAAALAISVASVAAPGLFEKASARLVDHSPLARGPRQRRSPGRRPRVAPQRADRPGPREDRLRARSGVSRASPPGARALRDPHSAGPSKPCWRPCCARRASAARACCCCSPSRFARRPRRPASSASWPCESKSSRRRPRRGTLRALERAASSLPHEPPRLDSRSARDDRRLGAPPLGHLLDDADPRSRRPPLVM